MGHLLSILKLLNIFLPTTVADLCTRPVPYAESRTLMSRKIFSSYLNTKCGAVGVLFECPLLFVAVETNTMHKSPLLFMQFIWCNGLLYFYYSQDFISVL